MIKWTIESRKIKELKDHPKNARNLTNLQGEHLETSIDKFGIIDKIIINTDNVIIGGHQRKRILKKKGIKEVECWVPERTLNAKEVEELNVRLNRNVGEWDWEKLANEWEPVELVEWGFRPSELIEDITKDISEEKQEKEKKKTSCPNCGHEF